MQTKRCKIKLTVTDVFDGIVDKLFDFSVLINHFLNLLQGVNDGRIVSAAKLLTDIDHRKSCHFSCNIDSNVSGIADIGAFIFL